MLCLDSVLCFKQYFGRFDEKSSRWFVFVWTARQPEYRPKCFDFFVLAYGRLWPVLTSLDLFDGYRACMRACLDGLFRDTSACSAWREKYVECERVIVAKYEEKERMRRYELDHA